ncbi:MAG: cellulase family glycosylhydrolase [Acidobacteria bacterium]|nr:cellulase family glycosylhydrolase [Acidobacteriota bacterium]
MDRRSFLTTSAAATTSAALPSSSLAWAFKAPQPVPSSGLDLARHRFGINYTPSHNWWFCWNDWNADPIRRDLDAIAELGADHLRILLIWPFFQPNPKWVSPAHLERLEQLVNLMGERHLDALVTVFTGQLSGWYFLPPFNRLSDGFFTDRIMLDAQELFIRELSRTLVPHQNVIGFDMGNEVNTCWSTEPPTGDAWMQRTLALMDTALPNHLHVNGVDHNPWFRDTTFSPKALAAQRFPVMHCYPFWTGAVNYGGPMDPPSVKLLAAMAALIRSYADAQQKPVFAGEFNTCIKELTDAQQAEWLDKAVHAAIEQGVSWFTYWDSHDVDRKYDFNPLEYTLGLLTNDGKVKPAGRVFKELADNYRGKPVSFPTASLPQPPVPHTQESTWRWILDWLEWKPRN